MKKLSLLFMLLSVALTALAGAKHGVPSRIDSTDVFGDEYHIYQRSNHGSAVNPATHTFMVPQDGIIEVVSWDGGSFNYIKNIVYGADKALGNYWVEASGEAGSLYVPMGQEIYVRNPDGSFTRSSHKAVLVWGTIHYDAATNQTTFTPKTEVSGATYSAEGNTIILEDTSGPVAIEEQDELSFDAEGLGLVWEEEEGEWTGYFEWGTEMDTSPYVINWQPEGELKTYTRTSDCIHFATSSSKLSPTVFSTEKLSDEGQIVFGNDGKVYLKDPFLSMSYNTWIMGIKSEDGTHIIINALQNVFAYDDSQVALKEGSCSIKTYNPSNAAPYDYLDLSYINDYSQIVYRVEGNQIKLENTSANLGAAYPENYNAHGLYFYDNVANVGAIEANIIYTLKSDEPSVQTIAPTISGYASEDGQSYYVVIVPGEPSTIYYNIEYPDGTTSAWAEYVDALSLTGEGSYTVNAYAVANGKQPSEQDHYQFTISPSPVTGISETTVGKEILSKRYFNAMGQEIEQPNGMTIIVTTYTDGTTTAVKVMK